ncbi:DUF397 domain-containing protein [Actinoallomurus vinaceus]
MTRIDQFRLAWRKSIRSNASGGCVEVAPVDGLRPDEVDILTVRSSG